MGWNDFSLPACGERFDNEDGTSRQDELRHCEVGDPLLLVREPSNPYDRMAVAIFTLRKIRVGYLDRTRAAWIGSKMDRGYDVSAIVERVKGRGHEDAVLGLVIRVNMEGDIPALVDDRRRPRARKTLGIVTRARDPLPAG